jgi:hypothetical protein
VNNIYGKRPADLGLIDVSPKEMMFWLYCPIKLPGQIQPNFPPNLLQFADIVQGVFNSIDLGRWVTAYAYLTAKTLWVTADNPGNRPGWHSDGFMTDDLNFIWSDCNGTLFWEPEERVAFVQDHHASLAEMEAIAEPDVEHQVVYPDKHLLLLDQGVIHRVADVKMPGMRTFVKLSISRHKYNLVGNSINHSLPLPADYVERLAERNHPVGDRS